MGQSASKPEEVVAARKKETKPMRASSTAAAAEAAAKKKKKNNNKNKTTTEPKKLERQSKRQRQKPPQPKSSSQPQSQTPPSLPIPIPIPNLHDMTNAELKKLIESSKSLTIDTIKTVATSLKKKRREEEQSNNNHNNKNNNNKSASAPCGFYSQEEDGPELQLAVRVMHPDVSKDFIGKIRFKLVPSRMKEPIFWEAIFTILKKEQRLVEQNAKKLELTRMEKEEKEAEEMEEEEVGGESGYSSESDEEDDSEYEYKYEDEDEEEEEGESNDDDEDYSDNDNEPTTTPQTQTYQQTNGSHHTKQVCSLQPSTSQDSYPDDELLLLDDEASMTLESQLSLRNSQVAYLTRQVKQLREQVQQQQQQLLQQQSNGGNDGTTNDATTNDNHHHQHHQHHGHWIVDKDSKEFLEYPDELKENMRKEKQKRLDQVLADMKFILDSDNVQDTNGYWDCCGATEYKTNICDTK